MVPTSFVLVIINHVVSLDLPPSTRPHSSVHVVVRKVLNDKKEGKYPQYEVLLINDLGNMYIYTYTLSSIDEMNH